jgi:hypothetical protein
MISTTKEAEVQDDADQNNYGHESGPVLPTICLEVLEEHVLRGQIVEPHCAIRDWLPVRAGTV